MWNYFNQIFDRLEVRNPNLYIFYPSQTITLRNNILTIKTTNMKVKLLLSLISLLTLLSCSQERIKTSKYLGQKIPIDQPELFGEGIISVDSTSESMISVTNDGLALYFTRYFKDENGKTNGVKSLYTRYDGTAWTNLKLKNKKMFYRTPRFVNDSLVIMAHKGCIWKSTKANDTIWTEPEFVDSLDLSRKNGVSDWSITQDLTFYYIQNGDIKTTRIDNGKIINDKKLQGCEGFKTRHIGVSPKGDYLICDGFIEGINNGWVDNFISFYKPDDSWSFPVHMDSTINIKNFANYIPRISPSGDVFFFSRQDSTNRSDFYWMSTQGFEKYKE